MATVQTPIIPLTKKPLSHLLLDPRLDEGLRVELMTIPPDLAAKWLKRNQINRPLQRRHIAALVGIIKSGAWDDANGETIIFGSTGALLDGQHRLTAVVEAQQSIVSLVVFGVTEHKRASIDTGSKRQLGDYLGMHGAANAKGLAAAVTMLANYEQGVLAGNNRSRDIFKTYTEAEAFVAAHPGLHVAVTVSRRLGRFIRPAYAAMLYYLFAAQDATLADHWVGTLTDGHIREPYEVFLTLRERLLRELSATQRIQDLEKVVYCIKAWNAARAGKPLKVFKWMPDEGIPSIV